MRRFVILFTMFVVPVSPAAAQLSGGRIQVAAQLATAVSSEFETTDVGIGGRFSWLPMPLVGIEGEMDFYPRDFPPGSAFSRARVEGLFGATVGPRLGPVRVFGRVRPGFVRFEEASGPIGCILIFPPPLSCILASGHTVFALDLGGGVELSPTPRTVLRADIGDRLLKYPGPAFGSGRVVRQESFYSHDFRLAVGAGLRF